MTDNRLYLHIGFGKCGSSALQSFLSSSPVTRNEGKIYEYAVLTERGRLIRRAELKALAEASLVGYLNSSPRVANFAKASAAVNRLLERDINLILSHEHWVYQPADFRRSGFLGSLNRPVVVVVYVRPQVEWLNSAWWQWLYWKSEFTSIGNYLETKGVLAMDWSRIIDKWSGMPNVERVIPRLLPGDIVGDFCGVIGLSAPSGEAASVTSNVTLTLPMLAFLARTPGIRGQNDSHVDFILQKRAPLQGRKPWAVAPDEAAQILGLLHTSNERLADLLDPASAVTMRSDPRWWSGDFYSGRKVDDPLQYIPTDAEKEEFLDRITRALISAERELFEKRRENAISAQTAARAVKLA